MPTELIARTETFVQEQLASCDGSHDWWHIHRVRATARGLALEEGADSEIVELAALLHDVKDWKYSGDPDAGANACAEWLQSQGYPTDRTEVIVDIVKNMGFKNELGGSVAGRQLSVEFKCVQDADRLDAIGAIGIGRTFCFGGAKKNPMHVPGVAPKVGLTMEEYVKSQSDKERPNTTINHFYEKLFTLKDKMKTEAGRRRAERRHKTMEEFVERFKREWDGEE